MDQSPVFSGDYCAVCGGWGYAPPTSGNRCTSCNGYGVKISKNYRLFFSKIPLLVDYGKREAMKTKKDILVGTGVFLLVAVVGLLVILLVYGLY